MARIEGRTRLTQEPAPRTFEQEASQQRSSLAGEFWTFLIHSKKWWLLPILVMMALMAGMMLLAGNGLAPFIYTMF